MEAAQKPLELILARNLLTSIATPAFLVDREGRLLFYNEGAGALLGLPFEDAGRMSAAEWTARFGPFDDDGEPIPIDELEVTEALRDGRPAHSRFCIRSSRGEDRKIQATALPIVGSQEGRSGAIVIFWPLADSEHADAAEGIS